MFSVGTFLPTTDNTKLPKSKLMVPRAGPVASIVHNDHHWFTYAGWPA